MICEHKKPFKLKDNPRMTNQLKDNPRMTNHRREFF
jgi:hypothetical protein